MSDWYDELTDYLSGIGHSGVEIEKILQRVKQYDSSTQHDSVMDSIANGQLNLTAIIKEALEPSD